MKLVLHNSEGQIVDTESILQSLPTSTACRTYAAWANVRCDRSQQEYVTSSCLAPCSTRVDIDDLQLLVSNVEVQTYASRSKRASL